MSRQDDYSAGNEKERWEDFYQMVFDPKIDAIGCIIGGFSAIDLLPFFNKEVFLKIKKNPKIFFGYSDFSLILNALFSQGIVSLHTPNIATLHFWDKKTYKKLYSFLLGNFPSKISKFYNWEPLVYGLGKGRLLVSNLASLIINLGTLFDPLNIKENLILAVEEVKENKSTVYQWLKKLSIHPNFFRIKGVIIGRFTEIKEKDYPLWRQKTTIEEIFLRVFKNKIPIASLKDFGHPQNKKFIFFQKKSTFLPLPNGIKVSLEVKKEGCQLEFLEKPVV